MLYSHIFIYLQCHIVIYIYIMKCAIKNKKQGEEIEVNVETAVLGRVVRKGLCEEALGQRKE